MTTAENPGFGWPTIARLGLVQMALGGIVALCTSTLNRVMVIEYALPAVIPAALIGLNYAVQFSRPAWGHGSDGGARRTPWIVGGLAMLALGAVIAAIATRGIGGSLGDTALGVLGFALVGAGVSAAGTSLLAMLASGVAPARRASAAAITWILMILGSVITATVARLTLSPFSHDRLVLVIGAVSLAAFLLGTVAIVGVERRMIVIAPTRAHKPALREALAQVWGERDARLFTLFVAASMLAYGALELVLEPFGARVFGLTPALSAGLAQTWHGGVLIGMIAVGGLGAWLRQRSAALLRRWTVTGCLGSAGALGLLALGGAAGPGWPLGPTVFLLGLANGMFAVAAIGSMMSLAGAGGRGQEGVRMGLWGGAQAIAFAVGGFLGATGADAARHMFAAPASGFILVFLAQAAVFLLAALIARRVGSEPATDYPTNLALKGST